MAFTFGYRAQSIVLKKQENFFNQNYSSVGAGDAGNAAAYPSKFF